MTNVLRIVLAAGGAALAGVIFWAMQVGDSRAAIAWLLSDPWGIVSMADLYLGFAISAAIIFTFERNKLLGAAIGLSIFVVGNVLAAAWVAWRLGELARRRGGDAA